MWFLGGGSVIFFHQFFSSPQIIKKTEAHGAQIIIWLTYWLSVAVLCHAVKIKRGTSTRTYTQTEKPQPLQLQTYSTSMKKVEIADGEGGPSSYPQEKDMMKQTMSKSKSKKGGRQEETKNKKKARTQERRHHTRVTRRLAGSQAARGGCSTEKK